MKNKKAQGEIITTVLILLLVLAAIVIVWQVASSTINNNPKKSDDLTSKYIKEIYPEFKNCSIIYNSCLNNKESNPCKEGANIYCSNNTLGNRDSLEFYQEKDLNLGIKIEFKNITIKDIETYYKVKERK
jgi:hypothetical protein